ncbi:UDP-glycosyltransferase 88A1-like [Hibiscus syriacus]|uniref:UDP-glycosyltransferase 88A1-like n=1 Tax=Hibiscus syriacus TaxID=106335 RepID=UPI001923C582|nr:UDP-glycosyltransferase 88A1-like [Hibiscus syriacus]
MWVIPVSTMAKKEAIVIYPAPWVTHHASMVELANLLHIHQPSLYIHILVAAIPSQPLFSASASASSAITFNNLPTVDLHPPTTHLDTLHFDFIRLNIPNLRRSLLTISESYTLNAIIVDFFCSRSAFEVASDLDLPAYCFYTGAAGSLASLLYLPTLHNKFTQSFEDYRDLLVDIPGVPPILSSDMPSPILKRNEMYEIFLDISTCLTHLAGIILNTFEYMEPRAIKAIANGLCVPNSATRPLYCIGSFIANAAAGGGDGVPECLKWLDSQPSKSVVFLCFGSAGFFSMQQLMEIAVGLERSGHRFLWVVRNPPSENRNLGIDEEVDPDLISLLPLAFLDRTKDRGYLLKSWAPQTAVLSHDSIGGFVTHCGWNSVLEAVCAGVPMLAWPLYAEQRYNRVLMVEEMKIALPMEELETGLVCSTEVEKRVKDLMESKEGDWVKERIIAMKNAVRVAVNEGGSSRIAVAELFKSWKQK